MIYNNTAKLTVFLFIGIFVLTQISFSQETAGGNSIFVQSRCANCHTIGRGRFVGPDLIKVGDRYSRGEIVNWAVNSQLVYTEKGKMPVNDGYPPMPPMNIDKDIAEKIADYLINYKVKPGLSAKGTIKGQIINKTQNMKAKDVDVLLTSYLGDKKIESKFEFTDKNGLFSFTGLDWDKSYEITVIYNKAEYVSNKMVFPPNQDLIHLELPVFDTTDSDEKLYINNLHTIVYNSPKENYANITNIYELINSGDRIFIGTAFDGKEKGVLAKTVSFSIPNKAVNINFLNGVNANDIIEDDGKLYDSSAFHPGVKRVVLSYDFPLNKSRNIADINSDYLIKSHIVLIKKDIFDAEVLGLDKLGEMVVYNEEFVKYEGNNLLPGEGVKLVFKKRVDLKKYNNYIPVAIFTVFIITGLIYMNLRKKKVVPENDVASLNKDELLKEIAKLDDLYESKGIDESEYKNKRSILKEKLISLYSADDQ